MMLHLLAACAQGRVIGLNNQLPWHLPADLKHFKALTMGHTLIMGRKTWDSIGRPLPGRTTWVISRQPDLKLDGATVFASLEAALQAGAMHEHLFVVGGGQIYVQALPYADHLHLTEISLEVAGDAWFPEFSAAEWQEIQRDQHIDDDSGIHYAFVDYQRRQPQPTPQESPACP